MVTETAGALSGFNQQLTAIRWRTSMEIKQEAKEIIIP
jgi:hypothetical protein